MADETKPDELAAFVTTTLLAIAQGIHAAQGTQIVSAHKTGVFGFTAPNEIEFDVAVRPRKPEQPEEELKLRCSALVPKSAAARLLKTQQ